MRDLIDLVETSTLGNYNHFIHVWGDHIADEDGKMPTKTAYQSEWRRFTRTKSFEAYRGIRVAPQWLDALSPSVTHLGTCWSQDWTIAEEFTMATSGYDDRFAPPSSGAKVIRVIMQAVLMVETIDLDASIASIFGTSEQELRMHEGQPVRLTRLWVDGRWVDHPALDQTFRA